MKAVNKMRAGIFLALLGFTVLLSGMPDRAGSLDKEYGLIFFQYRPLDLEVRVFTVNQGTGATDSETGYILPRIDPKTGDARLFLVKDSAIERDQFSEKYRYRVVFYKPQTIAGKPYRMPVYSFLLDTAAEGGVRVQYENMTEKVFDQNLDTRSVNIRDFDGGIFDLSQRLRTVKFTGRLRLTEDTNTVYAPLPRDNLQTVCLVPLDKDSGKWTGSREIIVPLNENILVGPAPFALKQPDNDERYRLKALLADGEESTNLVIHFAEVWKNIYEQKLLYDDDGQTADFTFDASLYQLKVSYEDDRVTEKRSGVTNTAVLTNMVIRTNFSYDSTMDEASNVTEITNSEIYTNTSFETNTAVSEEVTAVTNVVKTGPFTYTNAPFSLRLPRHPGSRVIMRLSARDYAARYLSPAALGLDFKVEARLTAAELVSRLATNREGVRAVDASTLYLAPDFNRTAFSVMSSPENARIFYKRLEPAATDWIELGESPVFFQGLDYGKYSFKAEWYDWVTNKKTLDLTARVSETTLEFSTVTLSPRAKKQPMLQYLTNDQAVIPFIEFEEKASLTRSRVLRSVPLSNTPAGASNSQALINDASNKIQQVRDRKTDNVKKTVKKQPTVVPVVKNAEPLYHVQLGAFKAKGNWMALADDFIRRYKTQYARAYPGEKVPECRTAYKTVKGVKYAVVLSEPRPLGKTRDDLFRNLRVIESAFIVSADEVVPSGRRE